MLTDSELNFENHTYSIINTANKMVGSIKRNFQIFMNNLFLLLFKEIVTYMGLDRYGKC